MSKMTFCMLVLGVVVATFSAEIGIGLALRDDPAWREEFRKKPNKLSLAIEAFRAVAMVAIVVGYFVTRKKEPEPQQAEV